MEENIFKKFNIIPSPELEKELEGLLTTQEFSVQDRERVMRRQPPRSKDALRIGDLYLAIRRDYLRQLGGLDLNDEDRGRACELSYNLACQCSMHMAAEKSWWELAIKLDPHNPIPYERLAREIEWEECEWPGETLEPLKHNYSPETLRQVMAKYQRGALEFQDFIEGIANELRKMLPPKKDISP